MPPPRVLCRGIFGKVAGSSHSKVLSSPSDGIAQIQGQCTCEGWGYTTSCFNLCSLSPSADPPAKVHRGLPQTSVSQQVFSFLPHVKPCICNTCPLLYLPCVFRSEYIPKMIANTGLPVKLVGAWTTLIGSQTNTASELITTLPLLPSPPLPSPPPPPSPPCSTAVIHTKADSDMLVPAVCVSLIPSLPHTPAAHIWEYKNFDDVQETLEKLKEDKVHCVCSTCAYLPLIHFPYISIPIVC